MFNIATLAVASTATLHLKDASGALLYDGDKAIRIVLNSPGSKAFAAVESRQTARAVKRMNDNEGKIQAMASEERRVETAEDLASITVAFENFTYGDGSLQGADLFQAAYEDPALGFIVKQVTKFLADWSNFRSASDAS